MKILLAVENVFSSIGGGQRFFSNLIRSNPDLDFYYLSSHHPGDVDIPGNAFPVPMSDAYRRNSGDFHAERPYPHPELALTGKEYDIAYLLDMAVSVSAMAFDVLDIPDYLPFGALLKQCMAFHGVQIGKVSLSMHGTMSMGLLDNWDPHISGLDVVIAYEKLLYGTADVRYGISSRYTAEWQAELGLPAAVIDPQLGLLHSGAALAKQKKKALIPLAQPPVPDLCFVGRQEKWKGPDIFIEICSSMPRDYFGKIRLVGPGVTIHGHSSEAVLNSLAKNRTLELVRETIEPSKIDDWFRTERMIVVTPSRRDTFNLVALEALLAGCPAVISIACGVCDYLDQAYPGLPYVRFDPDNIMASYDQIVDLLINYDQHQATLLAYLKDHPKPLSVRSGIADIYAMAGQTDPAAQAKVAAMFDEYQTVLKGGMERVRDHLAHTASERFGVFFNGQNMPINSQFARNQFLAACRISEVTREFANGKSLKQSIDAVETALPFFEGVAHGGSRVNMYRLLAAWEKCRGNDLLYATYQLRIARLTGRFEQAEMEFVSAILARHNYVEEAKVVDLIGNGNANAVYDYLHQRAKTDFSVPAVKFAKKQDLRGKNPVSVTIIVSVYNGAQKADAFVATLERLTAETKAITEVIFVDSNSPDDTANVLPLRLKAAKELGVSSLYVRTPDRETIQRAWNRGIDLAKGSYLAFLGLDEKVRPDALAIMAHYLDQHPGVDWVQGSAVVTEVNEQGSYIRDVMCYNRSFDMQEMHYLECCYISYVGALYRKSIHERFGYYDDRFRGAGDTEFKNRMLPFIKVVSLPETFGTFLNYPEERTTQSPMAELEDLRAWYLFRTVGGIRYGMERREAGTVVNLFHRSLHYKKSYMDKLCTDIEFASEIAEYVRLYRAADYERLDQFTPGLTSLQLAYRRFDEPVPPHGKEGLEKLHTFSGALERVWYSVDLAQKAHRFFGAPGNYWITNDNRWHQHHLLWPSISQKNFIEPALTPRDLEGNDLGELLSGCQSDSEWVDLERAWSSGKTAQLLRLMDLAELDVTVPEVNPGSFDPEQIARIEQLAEKSRLTVLMLGARPEQIKSASARLFFSGKVKNARPALAAAKIILFPWPAGMAGAAIGPLVLALGHGKPVVLSAAVLAELKKRYAGVNFDVLPCAHDDNQMAAICFELARSSQARKALRQHGMEIVQALLSSGAVAAAEPDMAVVPSNALVEWPVDGSQNVPVVKAASAPAPQKKSPASLVDDDKALRELLRLDLSERGNAKKLFSAAKVQRVFDDFAAGHAKGQRQDAKWRYLFEPVTVSEELPALSLQRVMLMVWQFRPDLQKLYPLHGKADRLDFAIWCLLAGSREYLALRYCLQAEVAAELEQPVTGLQAASEWDPVMPRLLPLLRKLRPDLAKSVDWHNSGARVAFLFWYLQNGRKELQLHKFALPPALSAMLAAPVVLPGGQITGLMQLEYQARPDLQTSFDLNSKAGVEQYGQWYRSHGIRFDKPNKDVGLLQVMA